MGNMVAIQRAVDYCKTQIINIVDHFREVTKMVELGNEAKRVNADFMLTRLKKQQTNYRK